MYINPNIHNSAGYAVHHAKFGALFVAPEAQPGPLGLYNATMGSPAQAEEYLEIQTLQQPFDQIVWF